MHVMIHEYVLHYLYVRVLCTLNEFSITHIYMYCITYNPTIFCKWKYRKRNCILVSAQNFRLLYTNAYICYAVSQSMGKSPPYDLSMLYYTRPYNMHRFFFFLVVLERESEAERDQEAQHWELGSYIRIWNETKEQEDMEKCPKFLYANG